MKSKKILSGYFIKVVLILAAFFLLILSSEFIYILKSRPQVIQTLPLKIESLEKQFLMNYYLNLPETPWQTKIYNRLTAEVLYLYLAGSERKKTNPKECRPLCLSFEESESLLRLFEILESKNAITFLSSEKKSKLYFWMSTISVWEENDEKTLEYLTKAVSLSNENNDALIFKIDFQKLFELEKNPSVPTYYAEKLERVDNLRQYEKTYLAKSAFKIASGYVSKNDIQNTIVYLDKATKLNPWNTTYYMALSETYLYVHKPNEAKSVLETCIKYLEDNSKGCQNRLENLEAREN